MDRSVQFWLVTPNGLDFVAMVDALADPWGAVHVRLTQEHLRELRDMLSEHVESEDDQRRIQDKQTQRE